MDWLCLEIGREHICLYDIHVFMFYVWAKGHLGGMFGTRKYIDCYNIHHTTSTCEQHVVLMSTSPRDVLVVDKDGRERHPI